MEPRIKMLGRLRNKILTLLAATALLAGYAAGPGSAQETSTSPDTLLETYGLWRLRCGPEQAGCHVFQALYRSEDNARVMQVTLFESADTKGAIVLRSLTPLGAVLAKGVDLSVDDGAPQSLAYLTCWRRGCVSEIPLSPDLEFALRAGKTLVILVVSADNGKSVRFDLSLNGIARALDQLQQK